MLYLGIDLHRKQLTVSLRDEQGDVTLRRQVSTRPTKVEEFLMQLKDRSGADGYAAMLEVCGFEEWLVKRLREEPACREVVVIQPEKPSKKKTDRRDANQLGEVLWVNRQRLLAGQKVRGVRRIYIPTPTEQEDRQLTAWRQRLGRRRTQTINRIRHILRRHNLEWEQPTKGFQTRKVRWWLRKLSLGEVDRVEVDQLLEQWEMWDRQIKAIEERIAERFERDAKAQLLATIIGVSCYMALAIASRIGDLSRFPSPRSLANFFGLTPRSRSTGDKERLGSISKEGSQIVRFLLGQLVVHVLRRDAKMRAWYKRIKQRRGSKIARVAVMRRLTVIMWHMLAKQEPYHYGGEPTRTRPAVDAPALANDLEKHHRELMSALGVRAAVEVSAGESTGSSSLSG